MDHAKEAARRLGMADNASGDHLSAAQEAVINALSGIGHILFDLTAAVREQTAAEHERRAIVP